MANIQTKLDITKNISTNKGFTGRLGDKGETLDFYLYDNGVELDLTGYTMAFVGNNSKNQYSTASGSRIENTINGMRVIIPSSFNSRVGDFLNCYVELRKGSTVVRSTGDFFYTVLPNADLDSEVADEYVSQLEELLNQINDRANQFFDTLVTKFEQLDEDITDLQNEFNTFNTTVMTKIDEIMNKLTSLDVYTKKETNDLVSNVILDGQTITSLYNFRNKVVASNTANVHTMDRYGVGTELKDPTSTGWVEATQGMYNNSIVVDGNFASQGSVASLDAIPQILIRFNIVAQKERDYPNLFVNLGLTTTAQKSQWLRENTVRLIPQLWGRGSGLPVGEMQLNVTFWNGSKWDDTPLTNNTNNVQLLSKNLSTSYIMDDGYMYMLVYGKSSDGTTQPSVAIDAVQCDHQIKLSTRKFYVPQTQIADGNTAGITKVIDNLNSLARTNALSAYAGKLLNDKIGALQPNIAQKNVNDLPATYPIGFTIFDSSTTAITGFPIDYGTVVTMRFNDARTIQWCFPKSFIGGAERIFIRGIKPSVIDNWGEWTNVLLGSDIVNTVTSTSQILPLSAAMGKFIHDKVDVINSTIADTGWVDLAFDSAWKPYNNATNNSLKIRRVHKSVYLRGTTQPVNDIPQTAAGTSVNVSATIPEQFRPFDNVYTAGTLLQGSGNNRYWAYIKNNKLVFERYFNGAGTELPNYASGHWYPVMMSWVVD